MWGKSSRQEAAVGVIFDSDGMVFDSVYSNGSCRRVRGVFVVIIVTIIITVTIFIAVQSWHVGILVVIVGVIRVIGPVITPNVNVGGSLTGRFS